MANEQNLKPLTSKKAREIGRKGGIASGKKKREIKLFKEILLGHILPQEIIMTVNGKEVIVSRAEAANLALVLKAEQGDVRAYEVLTSMIGQEPVNKLVFENPQDIIAESVKAEVEELKRQISNPPTQRDIKALLEVGENEK